MFLIFRLSLLSDLKCSSPNRAQCLKKKKYFDNLRFFHFLPLEEQSVRKIEILTLLSRPHVLHRPLFHLLRRFLSFDVQVADLDLGFQKTRLPDAVSTVSPLFVVLRFVVVLLPLLVVVVVVVDRHCQQVIVVVFSDSCEQAVCLKNEEAKIASDRTVEAFG